MLRFVQTLRNCQSQTFQPSRFDREPPDFDLYLPSSRYEYKSPDFKRNPLEINIFFIYISFATKYKRLERMILTTLID